jgi:SAM-dependent methyltransferase
MTSVESVDLETADCPLGCPREDARILTGRDRLHGLPGEFTVVRCRTCGLIRTDPRPTAPTIGFYYPDDYGPYRDTRVGPEAPAPARRPLWRRAASLLLKGIVRTNSERLPPVAPGRVLEIGCASGSFLHRMAREGWIAEGIEFSPGPSDAARRMGFRVHTGRIEEATEPEDPYDLVVGWMVLEHLHDPVRALRKIRGWTREAGWLVLSVPNAAAYEFPLFRSAWYALDLPRHLTHFDPVTLRRVLQKGGWRLERVFFQRDLGNVLASCGYVLRERGVLLSIADWLVAYPERPGRLALLFYPLAFLLSLFGQTGRMTVWARPDA